MSVFPRKVDFVTRCRVNERNALQMRGNFEWLARLDKAGVVVFRSSSHGFGLPIRHRLSRFSCNSISMRRVVKSRYIVHAIAIEGDRGGTPSHEPSSSRTAPRPRNQPPCRMQLANREIRPRSPWRPCHPRARDRNDANKYRDERGLFQIFLVTRVEPLPARVRLALVPDDTVFIGSDVATVRRGWRRNKKLRHSYDNDCTEGHWIVARWFLLQETREIL